MSIKTKDELLEAVKTRLGDASDDETLAFLEDFSDTIDSMSEGAEWQAKYEENDRAWRQKYHDRFFSSDDGEPDPEQEPDEKSTFEDLFKEG